MRMCLGVLEEGTSGQSRQESSLLPVPLVVIACERLPGRFCEIRRASHTLAVFERDDGDVHRRQSMLSPHLKAISRVSQVDEAAAPGELSQFIRQQRRSVRS